jgi:hypothetical protein
LLSHWNFSHNTYLTMARVMRAHADVRDRMVMVMVVMMTVVMMTVVMMTVVMYDAR